MPGCLCFTYGNGKKNTREYIYISWNYTKLVIWCSKPPSVMDERNETQMCHRCFFFLLFRRILPCESWDRMHRHRFWHAHTRTRTDSKSIHLSETHSSKFTHDDDADDDGNDVHIFSAPFNLIWWIRELLKRGQIVCHMATEPLRVCFACHHWFVLICVLVRTIHYMHTLTQMPLDRLHFSWMYHPIAVCEACEFRPKRRWWTHRENSHNSIRTLVRAVCAPIFVFRLSFERHEEHQKVIVVPKKRDTHTHTHRHTHAIQKTFVQNGDLHSELLSVCVFVCMRIEMYSMCGCCLGSIAVLLLLCCCCCCTHEEEKLKITHTST